MAMVQTISGLDVVAIGSIIIRVISALSFRYITNQLKLFIIIIQLLTISHKQLQIT